MTDRVDGCWVAFERDIRDDDVEPLLAAIRMVRGVNAVEAHVVDPEAWRNRERVRYELADSIRIVTALCLGDAVPFYLHNKEHAIALLEKALMGLRGRGTT